MNNPDMPNSMLENEVKANSNKIPSNCSTLELFQVIKLCIKAQNTLYTNYSGSQCNVKIVLKKIITLPYQKFSLKLIG